MTEPQKIDILYFTDVLCIWAYLAQARIDEVKTRFGTRIKLHNHFIPVFGSVQAKMEKNWHAKGGLAAYSEHVKTTAAQFGHVALHPDVWLKNTPTTSANCHLFLKAVQLLETSGELADLASQDACQKTVLEQVAWEMRLAFFRDLVDISDIQAQMAIAERLALPLQKIEQAMQCGAAFAALDDDMQLREKYGIKVSPSLVLNEGHQVISGNVGYRVIEANIQELLHQPGHQASWC
jgi:predicted DsbA family dithiol-disulfide isomerase